MNAPGKLIFPQYRKYKNGLSYFCFPDESSFEELRKMGTRWLIENYTARILPDRNFVHDLLYAYRDFAEEISQEEYEAIKAGSKP